MEVKGSLSIWVQSVFLGRGSRSRDSGHACTMDKDMTGDKHLGHVS